MRSCSRDKNNENDGEGPCCARHTIANLLDCHLLIKIWMFYPVIYAILFTLLNFNSLFFNLYFCFFIFSLVIIVNSVLKYHKINRTKMRVLNTHFEHPEIEHFKSAYLDILSKKETPCLMIEEKRLPESSSDQVVGVAFAPHQIAEFQWNGSNMMFSTRIRDKNTLLTLAFENIIGICSKESGSVFEFRVLGDNYLDWFATTILTG